MGKRNLLSALTKKELKWWGISIAAFTLEYFFYTRHRDLSPSDAFHLMAYQAAQYSPPPIQETVWLCVLFLLMVATGLVFLIFTHKLVVKFHSWVVQTSK